MRRSLRLLPIVWLFALLALPVAAYLVGVRQPEIENRTKTPYPPLNRGTIRKASTFQQLDAAILERLPLRGDAIDLRGHLAIDLFRDSPNANVLLGSKGWLYYQPEFRTCEDVGRPTSDPADAAEILSRTLVASGRRAGVLVVGSKIVTHGQRLRDVDPAQLRCVAETERRVHERLRKAPGGLTIQPQLDALERRGTATFLRNDTHWNAAGREVFLRATLDRIKPGLADRVGIVRGPDVEHVGDLGPFIGMRRTERDPVVTAARTPVDPIPAGDVLLIGDSQLNGVYLTQPPGGQDVLDRVLPGQPTCSWPELANGQCDKQLLRSRSVITEVVGRNMLEFNQECWRPVNLLAARMTGRPARWERTDGGPDEGGRRLSLTDGSASVRIRVAGADVRNVPRLLRLPIEQLPTPTDPAVPAQLKMAQTPQAGPPSSCQTPAQTEGDGTLTLAVPAGRRASDLVIRLEGPPGTRLGTPEEIVLDGRRVPSRR